MPGCDALLSLIATVGLAAVLLAYGDRVRRWLRLPASPGIRPATSLAIGSWALALPLLALGLAGALRSLWILAVVAVAAGLGRWRSMRRLLPRPAVILAGGVLALPAAAAFPFFYDAWVYHLGLPWQALIEHGFHPHVENLFSTFPPLAQLTALPALAASLPRVPALLHLVACLFVATTIAALARRLGAGRRLAEVAGVAFLLAPPLGLVVGFPAAEGWFLVALVPAVAIAVGAPRLRWAPFAAGLLAGIATASRLQGAPWGLLILALILVRYRRVWPTAATLGGLAAGAAPWWVKNAILLGSPFAPIGWHRPGIETLWRDAGSWLASGRSPIQCVLSLPSLLAPFAGFVAPLLLAAVLSLLAPRGDRRRLALLIAGGLAAWSATGTLERFLAPSVALLLALAVAGRSRATRLAGCAVVVTTAALGIVPSVRVLAATDLVAAPFINGGRGTTRLRVNDPLPAYRAARLLPSDARLLLVGETRPLLCPRRMVVTSQHDVSPLRTPLEEGGAPAALRWLHRHRITYVLINRGEMERLAPGYPVAPWRTERGRDAWWQLVGLLGRPAIIAGPVVVLPTTRGSPPSPP
ncbi:MAG: hypothetical protein LJE95_09175 [Acidobacteria bacterium]|nr:hypothetical protein [Acidobacteriota bacterium]